MTMTSEHDTSPRRDRHRRSTGHDTTTGHNRRNRIAGKYTALLVEVLESPPWRVLSLSAHRVIDRVCLELAYQGGHQKEGLCVTFSDFEDHGIERHGIKQAVDEAVFLGFLCIVRKGRGGNAGYRRSTLYQLTFVNSIDTECLHSWKRLRHKSLQQIKKLVVKVRQGKQNPVWDSHTEVSGIPTLKTVSPPV
jgi:hypothetical protein